MIVSKVPQIYFNRVEKAIKALTRAGINCGQLLKATQVMLGLKKSLLTVNTMSEKDTQQSSTQERKE
jgi:hypothetical protein